MQWENVCEFAQPRSCSTGRITAGEKVIQPLPYAAETFLSSMRCQLFWLKTTFETACLKADTRLHVCKPFQMPKKTADWGQQA